jgi:cysteine desulfurase
MGLDERLAHGQVRFSLSRFNTDAEIDQLVAILPRVIDKVSAIAVP